MSDFEHYESLARLFSYPTPGFPSRLRVLREALASRAPDAAAHLDQFIGQLPAGDGVTLPREQLDEVQELFTRSFEVQAVTTLDVGYVAFGDDYKRGEMLVNLNRELRAVDIDPGTELSDHLSSVLKLLARWEDTKLRAEFVELVLHPVVEKMLREFDAKRILERNALYEKHYKTLIETSPVRGTAYLHALAALLAVLRVDFGLGPSPRPELASDFLRNISRELDVEARGEGQRPAAGRTP